MQVGTIESRYFTDVWGQQGTAITLDEPMFSSPPSLSCSDVQNILPQVIMLPGLASLAVHTQFLLQHK